MLVVSLAGSLLLVGGSPEIPEPATTDEVPAPTGTAAEVPPPVDEFTPVAEPVAADTTAPEVASAGATPPRQNSFASAGPVEEDGSPVARAKPGQFGMQFTFGGLAPLSIAGINDLGVGRLLFSEIGFRRVTERLIIPFSIGAGVFHHSIEGGSKQNDFGLAASVGVLKPFRVWRRISPYFGGMFHVHYVDPTGPDNWLVNVAIGPTIGTEFYIGHRVSLLFQADARVGINAFDGLTQVSAATSLAAGGQTGLVFYF